MKDVDLLLRENRETLHRIEQLQKAKQAGARGSVSLHARRFSNQLMNLALAAGLVGLSMLRYHENHEHRAVIADLQKKGEALAVAVEAAIQVDDDAEKEKEKVRGRGWWGWRVPQGRPNAETVDRGLREALSAFRGGGFESWGGFAVVPEERIKKDVRAQDSTKTERPMI